MLLWIYKGGLNLFGVTMAAKTWKCADGVGEVSAVRPQWLCLSFPIHTCVQYPRYAGVVEQDRSV